MTKHGAPDWSKYRPTSKSFSLEDLAELAARLDSIVTFDRRGDVIWTEKFEHGIQLWTLSISGTGASIAISPTTSLSRGYSARITCRSDGSFTTGFQNWVPFTPHGNLGVEAAFTLASQHTVFALTLYTYDGTDYTAASIRYVRATKTVEYMAASTAWIALTPTQKITPGRRLFNHMKLVTDPDTNCYVRALVNHVEYPLADIPTYVIESITTARLNVDISYTGANGVSPIGYVDNIIVTQDEP